MLAARKSQGLLAGRGDKYKEMSADRAGLRRAHGGNR